MKKFILDRIEDETGISGTGYVAEGVQFSNGKCVLCWLTDNSSIGVYDNMEVLKKIHGHDGKTVVKWKLDDSNNENDRLCPEYYIDPVSGNRPTDKKYYYSFDHLKRDLEAREYIELKEIVTSDCVAIFVNSNKNSVLKIKVLNYQ